MSIINYLKTLVVKNKLATKANTSEHPYFNARRIWNEHIGSIVASRQTWQMIGILSMLIALTSVGGIIYLGSQPKFVPLVFREDAQQNIISVTRGDKMGTASLADYRSQAERFIEDVRLVTPDIALQRRAIFRAYAALAANDPATIKTNEFLQNNSPFERAGIETVNVEIKSIIKATENSWQLDWIESVRDRNGAIKDHYMMRALITLYQNEPTTKTSEEEVLNNPHFIFVRDYNWSKLQNEVN
jgi:type IV secretory pathway TrbF-like protein